MTMPREKKNSIWNLMNKDQDIDDMIFGSESSSHHESESCSDR